MVALRWKSRGPDKWLYKACGGPTDSLQKLPRGNILETMMSELRKSRGRRTRFLWIVAADRAPMGSLVEVEVAGPGFSTRLSCIMQCRVQEGRPAHGVYGPPEHLHRLCGSRLLGRGHLASSRNVAPGIYIAPGPGRGRTLRLANNTKTLRMEGTVENLKWLVDLLKADMARHPLDIRPACNSQELHRLWDGGTSPSRIVACMDACIACPPGIDASTSSETAPPSTCNKDTCLQTGSGRRNRRGACGGLVLRRFGGKPWPGGRRGGSRSCHDYAGQGHPLVPFPWKFLCHACRG